MTALCPYGQPRLMAQCLCTGTQDQECTSTAAPEAGFCKVITEHRLGNLHHSVVPYFARVCSQTPSQNKNQHFQLRKAEGQSRSCEGGSSGMAINWKHRDARQGAW